jgi:dihydrolipoamide dehydrogenase
MRVLSRAAGLLELKGHAKDYGVAMDASPVNFTKLTSRKNVAIKTLVAGVEMLLKGNGVEIIEGTAALTAPGRVSVTTADGTLVPVEAKHIMISTGSRCRDAGLPGGGGRILDSAAALQLTEVPESLIIVGSGFVGLGFATIFSAMGTKVTVVDGGLAMLPGIDGEIAGMYLRELKKSKVAYLAETKIAKITRATDRDLEVALETGGKESSLKAEYVLMAEEREANLDGLDIKGLGIRMNDNGGIAVNSEMKTNVAGIWAAGDVTMENMWTPVAYKEGMVAAENIMGRNAQVDYSAIPYWTNTIPSIAAVGITEEVAKAKGYDVKVGRFSFAGNGMATILGRRSGLVKVVAEKKYGQLLGVHILGADATELIAQAAMAIRLELTPEDIGDLFYAHPSLSEAFWEAIKDVRDEALHSISRRG